MMGAIAGRQTIIHNFAESADCASTLECLRRLGVTIRRDGAAVTIEGRGLEGLRRPRQLDAGNSGTTNPLHVGPRCRIFLPSPPSSATSRCPAAHETNHRSALRRFGATIEARDDNFLPLKIRAARSGDRFHDADPERAAEVRGSSCRIAGARDDQVHEPVASRNHTEIALEEFGAHIRTSPNIIEIDGGYPLRGKEFSVPGDVSSAAFFIAAVLAVPNSQLRLSNVGLNPTRSGFISLLEEMQAKIEVSELSVAGGEPVGDITVKTSAISGMEIGGHWIPNVIDEIPVLAVLGTRTQKGIRIRAPGASRERK
jgi:3-phosphoshikimate 1-carboxyvinyltransferase